MFDKLRPKLIAIVNSGDWEADAQIVSMNLEDDSVLKLELQVDGTDIEVYLKIGHLQVALNEMILKQNQLIKKEQSKVQEPKNLHSN